MFHSFVCYLSCDEVSAIYSSNATFNTRKVTPAKSHFLWCLMVIVVFHQVKAQMQFCPLCDPFQEQNMKKYCTRTVHVLWDHSLQWCMNHCIWTKQVRQAAADDRLFSKFPRSFQRLIAVCVCVLLGGNYRQIEHHSLEVTSHNTTPGIMFSVSHQVTEHWAQYSLCHFA